MTGRERGHSLKQVPASQESCEAHDLVNNNGAPVEQDLNIVIVCCRSDPLISSDVYSRSLRFSHIDRPDFVIDRASPLSQRRGTFQDEEDRIMNLFTHSRSQSAKL